MNVLALILLCVNVISILLVIFEKGGASCSPIELKDELISTEE